MTSPLHFTSYIHDLFILSRTSLLITNIAPRLFLLVEIMFIQSLANLQIFLMDIISNNLLIGIFFQPYLHIYLCQDAADF